MVWELGVRFTSARYVKRRSTQRLAWQPMWRITIPALHVINVKNLFTEFYILWNTRWFMLIKSQDLESKLKLFVNFVTKLLKQIRWQNICKYFLLRTSWRTRLCPLKLIKSNFKKDYFWRRKKFRILFSLCYPEAPMGSLKKSAYSVQPFCQL